MFLRPSNVLQSECGYIHHPFPPFLVPDLLHAEPACVSALLVLMHPINSMETSVLVISTKGILSARHVGLWEQKAERQALIAFLCQRVSTGTQIWGISSWKISNQSGRSSLKKPWKRKSSYNSRLLLGQLTTTSHNWSLPLIGCWLSHCRDIRTSGFSNLLPAARPKPWYDTTALLAGPTWGRDIPLLVCFLTMVLE